MSNGRAALDAYLGPRSAGPMFYGTTGRTRLPRATLRKAWNAACADAGVQEFHLHDLRHVSLSLAAQSGLSLASIKERGGHASLTAAMRYQHVTDDHRAADVAALDRALGS